MRVLIVGSGGREHALAWRLSRDSDVSAIFSAPGNPGISGIGPCLPADLAVPADLVAIARRERIDLTVVGPEAPLERGLADLFREHGLAIVGPGRRGAALECSKSWAKAFMLRHGIPTARFADCQTLSKALDVLGRGDLGMPLVVKADGLAGGKGVTVAETKAEAEAAIRDAMERRRFGEAGARLVLEECLVGPEVSFFALVDGDRAVPLGSAQDHKRIFDDDRGPNTGGMGAFAPSPLVSPAFTREIMKTIVEPVIAGMRAEGEPYRGFLYVSLMLTASGPKVIEFNVRLGDPEAQVVLPQLDGRFGAALHAAASGGLVDAPLGESGDRLVGVVLAAPGYPDAPVTGQLITGVDLAADLDDVIVFHAGTREAGGELVTAGGRVLTVVGRGRDFGSAIGRAYAAVERIHFDGMQYRRDIGRKAIGA